MIVWLCFWFSSNLIIFTICDHWKAKKIRVPKAVSSLFSILCFLPQSKIWTYLFFWSTGTRKGTNVFTGPANLRKFVAKHYVMELNLAKIYIWACVDFQNCRDLSPFGNFSHGAFFSFDVVFRRRGPMNITGAVAGFHHIQNCIVLLYYVLCYCILFLRNLFR